ncbi:lytic polysaccharide monooxygenase [Micromonospora sp. NPDC050417]|uniref:lytic polysaccharide monooxygenase n=1 Tax=Micromonospora sp. NPDC050417 TaxID=3364280 RepID=UPI0037A5C3E1
MRRLVAYPLVALGLVTASLAIAAPAQAHGYISSPPSRQALCASGRVTDCGQIQYEPQSVEGLKGQRSCNAGLDLFAVLNDGSRNWPATSVGNTVTFNWVLTARHSTSSWEYYIGDQRLAFFEDGGRMPDATVSHQVNLGSFTGRQTLLAIWNIGDTPRAFYSCVDLQIGGGNSGLPSPTAAPQPGSTMQPQPGSTAAPQPGSTMQPQPIPTTAPEVGPHPEPSHVAPPAHVPTTAPRPSPTGPKPRPSKTSEQPVVHPPAAPTTRQAAPRTSTPRGREWAPGTTYSIGDEVTYQGVRYRCRQSHTSIVTWEPSYYTLALWLPI